MTPDGASIHASAVLVGDRAVVVRGPSGSGKSRLAFDLIMAGKAQQIPRAVLVGDDRVHIMRRANDLIVTPASALTGLIEIRGIGVRRIEHAWEARVGLIIDLAAGDAARMPDAAAMKVDLHGVVLPRVPIAAGHSALPLVIAALTTHDAGQHKIADADCTNAIR